MKFCTLCETKVLNKPIVLVLISLAIQRLDVLLLPNGVLGEDALARRSKDLWSKTSRVDILSLIVFVVLRGTQSAAQVNRYRFNRMRHSHTFSYGMFLNRMLPTMSLYRQFCTTKSIVFRRA